MLTKVNTFELPPRESYERDHRKSNTDADYLQKAYLQKEGQFGVSKWDMRGLFIAQSIDDISQTRKGFIDALCFLQAISRGIRLTYSLASC